jgi:predicted dehydrogenase
MRKDANSLRVAVVGCGHWGPNHIRNFKALSGVAVTWAVDKDPQRRAYVSSQFEHLTTTDDVDEMLSDKSVTAVVVATPTANHYEICMKAIAAGKHVLCEKPLATTSLDCEQLMDLAAQQGVVLMVGHVFLFNGGILKLKELISFNDLGRLYYASAVRTNLGPIRDDVNASVDLASHDISIFNFLFGSAPISASACGHSYLKQGVEDVVFITLTYPDEMIAGIEVSWLNPQKVRRITLVGDKKMVTWDDLSSSGAITIYDKGVIREPYYDSYGEFHLLAREGDVTIPKLRLEEPLKQQARFFVDAIAKKNASVCSGERGWDVVRTLEAINESMRNLGAPVQIETYEAARSRKDREGVTT